MSTSMANQPGAQGQGWRPGDDATSLGDLLSEVSRDLSTLMRQELELAKAELARSATRAGRGAGMFTGAAVAGHMVLVFGSIALWWGLGALLDTNTWSAVIVAAGWAVVGAVLALRGRRELKAIRGLPKTADSIKKIPDALKPDQEAAR